MSIIPIPNEIGSLLIIDSSSVGWKSFVIISAIPVIVESPTGTADAIIPRRRSSFAPSKVNGVPSSSSFEKYISANLETTAEPIHEINAAARENIAVTKLSPDSSKRATKVFPSS